MRKSNLNRLNEEKDWKGLAAFSAKKTKTIPMGKTGNPILGVIHTFFGGFLWISGGKLSGDAEKQKIEKEFILSMIQDFQADTSNLQGCIRVRKEKREMMDSLTFLLTTEWNKQFGNAT